MSFSSMHNDYLDPDRHLNNEPDPIDEARRFLSDMQGNGGDPRANYGAELDRANTIIESLLNILEGEGLI